MLAGFFARARGDARKSARERHHGVVRRSVAVHGDAVERDFNGGAQHFRERLGRQSNIRGDEAEHGGHARVDHAGAFGHAGEVNGLAFDLRPQHAGLWKCVRGHDRACEGGGILGREHLLEGWELAQDEFRSERDADDSRRGDQDLLGRHAEQFCGGPRRLLGRAQTRAARAGVGVARVDDDGAGSPAACSEVLPAKNDGRRGREVGREGARGGGLTRVRDQQGQVERPFDLLDPCGYSRAAKTRGGGQLSFDSFPGGHG